MTAVTHIIHLREDADFPAPFSGAENHLLVLLDEQKRAGLDVELVVLLQGGGPQIAARLAELEARGITTHTFPFRPMFDPGAIAKLRRHLRSRRGHIIHTHLDGADVNGRIAARLADVRHIVSTVHNQEMHRKKLKWQIIGRLLQALTGHYIAISHAVRQFMIDVEGIPHKKIMVIPYGIPIPDEIKSAHTLRDELGLPHDDFILGFVGRLTAQKNLPLLLNALHILRDEIPNLLAVIVGTGEMEDELHASAVYMGLSNVHFQGYLPHAADMMPAFDALCLPSKWEGLGLVLVEAMYRQVPIIASDGGAIPEVLDTGRCGLLFESDNVDSLVLAIRQLHAFSTEERKNLTDRAFAHAQEAFRIERMTARTQEVYDRVLSL